MFVALFTLTTLFATAQSNGGYTYATGLSTSNQYPIKIIVVGDDYINDTAILSNGKTFPILNRIIRGKSDFIGGTLENMTTKKKTTITNMTLTASGKEGGLFSVVGSGFSMNMQTSSGAIASTGETSIIFWDGKDYWKVTKKA